MGNYRFRLSDMMPNAWFYKLKDMGRATRNQSTSHSIKRTHTRIRAEPTTPKPHPPSSNQSFLPNRASYYFPRSETEKFPSSPTNPKATDTHFPLDPPRKSKRKSRRTPLKPSTKLITSSVSSGCSCRVMASESPYSDHHEDDDLCKSIIGDEFEFDSFKSWSRSCSCRVTSSATDIIIDVGSKSSFTRKLEKFEELELPPILTKPTKKEAEHVKLGGRIETTEKLSYINGSSTLKEQSKSPSKRSPARLHRLRIRGTSPRFASRKIQAYRARRSSGLSESFAIVKSSSDPQRDFRDSMVEMIVENNIRASKDLEELLACYLTLNSNEYHDVIVKVFEQIWFDLAETIRL